VKAFHGRGTTKSKFPAERFVASLQKFAAAAKLLRHPA
jgi:hypothetical protein